MARSTVDTCWTYDDVDFIHPYVIKDPAWLEIQHVHRSSGFPRAIENAWLLSVIPEVKGFGQ